MSNIIDLSEKFENSKKAQEMFQKYLKDFSDYDVSGITNEKE